jgi:SAM-dependent methyltransferase
VSARHLRVELFYRLLGPVQARARRARMRWFLEFLQAAGEPPPRILDLGGLPAFWADVPQPLDVTILNLPGTVHETPVSHHRFTYVEGDACDVRQFADRSFDVVFSNSVIEHVGDVDRQAAFAREVLRLGRRYWVQTPSKYFPIEAHCGMPGWWFYPRAVRERFIRRWREKLPAWTEMIEGTRVLSKARLRELFPGGRMRTERLVGWPKSYVIHSE